MLTAQMAVRADTIYSNYGDLSDDYDVWNNTSPSTEIVEPFTTEANVLGQWDVEQIVINGYGGGIMGGGSSPATVRLYLDEAGSPGSLVSGGEWEVNIDSSMGDDFSFSVSGSTLDASADYWFGLEATGNNAVGWRRTGSYGTPGLAGHVFALNGVAVPEPATLALMGLGGVLTFLGRRRRR